MPRIAPDYSEPALMTPQEAVNALTILRASRVWTTTLNAGGPRLGPIEGDPLLASFGYKNWKGAEHTYTVLPESVEFGNYDDDGVGAGNHLPRWVLHAQVAERSGVRRSFVRRTFLLDGIHDLLLVNEGGEPFTLDLAYTDQEGKAVR